MRKTDPVMWESDKAPEKEAEQIIYELHVKEFSWDASGGFPVAGKREISGILLQEILLLYGDGKHPTGTFLSEKSRGQLCTADAGV